MVFSGQKVAVEEEILVLVGMVRHFSHYMECWVWWGSVTMPLVVGLVLARFVVE